MSVDDLERALQAERPELDSEFARKLDEWAAAGFPRGGELDPRASASEPRLGGRRRPGRLASASDRIAGRLARHRDRLGPIPPRRLLAPVGAVATLLVVVGVAISQSGEITGEDAATTVADSPPSAEPLEGAASPGGSQAAPSPGSDAAAIPDSAPGAKPAAPGDTAGASTEDPRAGASAAESAGVESTIAPPGIIPPPDGGGIARGVDERLKDATARLSLGADADEVQEVANGVIEVTDRHRGVVVNSQVTSDEGGARASFELEIPFARLDAALSELSELGDVISRTEATEDITARAVRARKDLADTLEQIRKLRIELIEADSREEKLVIRSQISSLKAQADALEAQFNGVKREARFATVSVEVTSSGATDDDGEWGLDDALEDAGDVLTTLGGIALISLAVLVPLGLVVALALWITSSARRQSRERALDD